MTPVALTHRRLTRWQLAAAAAAGIGLTLLVFAVSPLGGRADVVVAAAAVAVLAVWATSRAVEGARMAKDRLAAALIAACFVIAVLPLAAVIGYTFARGARKLSLDFLTHSMAGVGPLSSGGGVYAALVGTVEQVLIAALIAVPLGLLVAVYVTEYGGTRLSRAVRFMVDVMTGVPSIVAGLFVFAFWVLGLHRGFSGFAGGMALAILMLPVIVRTTEEMLRLVPSSLREASYALGIPQWRTVLSVVLPTAAPGIVTGVMLAVARVTGETAPLLLTVSGFAYINNNPFSGAQASLPLFIYQQAQSPFPANVDRAWAAATVLILFVVVLYVAARLLTRRNRVSSR